MLGQGLHVLGSFRISSQPAGGLPVEWTADIYTITGHRKISLSWICGSVSLDKQHRYTVSSMSVAQHSSHGHSFTVYCCA